MFGIWVDKNIVFLSNYFKGSILIVNTQKLAPMSYLYDAYQSKNGKKCLDELGISKHLPHGVPSYTS